MKQQVQFVERRRHTEFIVLKDRWEFNPKGRFQALQRWAWRFLQWRRSLRQAVDERATFTRHVIDSTDVLRRLLKQRKGLFDYGHEPRELLIGAEDFAELMGSVPFESAAMFRAEYGREQQIMGLTIRVVPWMRGMVVMP